MNREMSQIKPPTPNPCGSCPYRRDVPSGLWAEEEYDKLPEYDRETGEQPHLVFMCHQQNDHACAGWTAVHDMNECLGLRLGVAFGRITPDDAHLMCEYNTAVPLFSSGKEAAIHGRRKIKHPGAKAARMIAGLIMKRRSRE